MHRNSLPDFLTSRNACPEACDWAEGRLVDEAAYLACPRGDWLLWILARLGLPRPQLVLAACACARTALRYVPEGEERPRIAIEVAEAWARGAPGADLEEALAAAGDAIVAAGDAIAGTMVATPAAYAAYAAAHAAEAAYADAAADAAYAAGADCVNYVKALAECADIVRGIIPWDDVARLIRS